LTSSRRAQLRNSGLSGVQEPRISLVPPATSSLGQEATELAARAGLFLDPWQQLVLERSLGVRPDGRWAAFEVGLVVSRQNGKGSILEARELAGLFLLGERLIIHSAHQFDTSKEHFARLLALVESTPEFDRRVRKVSRTHGSEGITLNRGQRISFRTRTKSGGRGFTADCIVFDEAMDLEDTAIAALMPTLSTRPNPQIWYTGSAVDQTIHEHGLVLAGLRERALSCDAGDLAFLEWSVEADNPADLTGDQLADPVLWGQANPGMGIRITPDFISRELNSAMGPRAFAVERLGAGDWPDLADGDAVIALKDWLELKDIDSKPVDPVVFAFDITPDRSKASISVAGKRPDGLNHVETVESEPGTGWLVPRLADLAAKHTHVGFVCDGIGPAASFLPELKDLGLKVSVLTAKEHAQACGSFFDAVQQRKLRHIGQLNLSVAIKGAQKRPLGDAWAWSRKTSTVDISPLVAATLAFWGSQTLRRPAPRLLDLAAV